MDKYKVKPRRVGRLANTTTTEEKPSEREEIKKETHEKFNASLDALLSRKDESLEKFLRDNIPAMKRFQDFLKLTLDSSEYNNACFITGPAGIRKSFYVCSELQQRKLPFIMYNSHSTALALYEILYRGRESIILFDDMDSILSDIKSINLLKAACFATNGARMVSWNSTSKILVDRGLPDRFVFNGKILIIANDAIKTKKESFRAFVNRLYAYNIQLSKDERLLLVRAVLTKQDAFGLKPEHKEKMLRFMEATLNFSNIENYNLRTAFKAADIWKHTSEESAKELIFDLLGTDDNFRVFMTVEELGRNLPVAQRIEVWKQYSGYSAREYYRIKREFYKTEYGTKYTKMLDDAIARKIDELGGAVHA